MPRALEDWDQRPTRQAARAAQAPATSGRTALENMMDQALTGPTANMVRAGHRLATGRAVPVPEVPQKAIPGAEGLTYADRYGNAPPLAPGDYSGAIARAPGQAVDAAKNVGGFYAAMLSPIGNEARGALLARGAAAALDPVQLAALLPATLGLKAGAVAAPVAAARGFDYAGAIGRRIAQAGGVGGVGAAAGGAVNSAASQYADAGAINFAQLVSDTAAGGLIGFGLGAGARAAGAVPRTGLNAPIPGPLAALARARELRGAGRARGPAASALQPAIPGEVPPLPSLAGILGAEPWQMPRQEFFDAVRRKRLRVGDDDAPDLGKMVQALRTAEGPPGVRIENEVGPGKVQELPNFKVVVARDDAGKPIGALSLALDDHGRPDILNIAIAPAHRRKGVASKLYDAARRAGYDVDTASGAWGMTDEGMALQHARRVRAAVRAGEAVPPEVLADYPDLARPR